MNSRGLLVLLAMTAAASAGLLAQDAALRFEVASVKPSGPRTPGTPGGERGRATNTPERLTYERTLFRTLLMDAYGVQRDQIKGPDWAIADAIDGGALFDVSATISPGATKEQVAAMLQNLLKERFNLSLHHTTVQSNGYALVIAKGGSKLKASAGPIRESERASDGARGRGVTLQADRDGFPNLFPERNMGGTFTGGTARIRFRDYPLSDLVQQFSFALAARIIDKTGLTGKYDFTLEFTPPENGSLVGLLATLPLSPGQQAPLSLAGANPGQLDSASAVSSAMEKQLGLKLEASKIPVDVLVIDHVDKTPTPN